MVRGLEKAFQAEDTGYGDIMIYRDVLTKLPMPELHYCHRALGSTTSARTLDNKTQDLIPVCIETVQECYIAWIGSFGILRGADLFIYGSPVKTNLHFTGQALSWP